MSASCVIPRRPARAPAPLYRPRPARHVYGPPHGGRPERDDLPHRLQDPCMPLCPHNHTTRRDGRRVPTPGWAVPLESKLYVVTANSTGKARRVRATGRVRFAPCTFNGRRILGEWQEGTGRIVQDEARRREALAALQRKDGWEFSLAMLGFPVRGASPGRVVIRLNA